METALEWNDEGIRLYKAKSYQQAIDAYLKAIELNGKDATFYKNLGDTYFDFNQWENANESYLKAIQMNNTNWVIFNDFGLILVGQKRYKDALKQYQVAQKLSPNQMEIKTNLAEVYYLLNEWQQSLLYSQQIIAQEPANLTAVNQIGLCYYQMKNFDQALVAFNQALTLSPNNAVIMHEMAKVYLDRKSAPEDFTRGVKYAQDAYQIAPNNYDIMLTLVHLYVPDFFYGTICQMVNKYLENDPDNGTIHNLLGNILLKGKNFTDAQHHLSIATQKEPQNEAFLKDTEKMAQSLGEWKNKLANLKTALVDPSQAPSVFLHFAAFLFASRQFKETIYYSARFLKEQTTNEVGIFLYGLSHYLENDFKSGLKILLIVSRGNPANWRVWLILAHFEKSEEYLQKAYEFKPELKALFPTLNSILTTEFRDNIFGITLEWII